MRLEPLGREHAPALVRASNEDPSLYRLSPVPLTEPEAATYADTAARWQAAGTALPFAVVRKSDGAVVGSTRFFDVERWAWPVGHARLSNGSYDGAEIGYTWYAASAVKTAVNTETKLLLLTHAFEAWDVMRVCFHADVRNTRSRNAIERIGARFEGVLRAHRLSVDIGPRDSARFSIVAAEWPEVKARLTRILRSSP